MTVRDRTGPKEIVHADLVTEWVLRLKPEADDALLLAARASLPAVDACRGRATRRVGPDISAGARTCTQQHAGELGALLADAGYDAATIARVQAIVRKDGLARAAEHDDVQVLEDALCLVFLETQLVDIAARLEPAKLPGCHHARPRTR